MTRIHQHKRKIWMKRKRRQTKKKTNKTNPLFWSSLVLITNMWLAFFIGQYTYSFLFASLTISSLIVHSYHNIITNLWDKVWVFSVVLYGGYQMYLKRESANPFLFIFCVLTFLFCVWVYLYGFIESRFVFDRRIQVSNIYHIGMHCIGSLGHHAILIL